MVLESSLKIDMLMRPDNSQLPFVTIAIPILNEAAYIEKVLDSVVAQDYPAGSMEVILADGFSTDGTRELVEAFVQRQATRPGPCPPITLIDNPKRIVSTALNEAIRMARGEIIVRVDAHTIIASDYVSQCVRALERSGADGVGGPMISVGVGYTAEAIALATSTPFAIGNSKYRSSRYFQEGYVETTHMGAYRKETLFDIGLFNEQFVRHQDYELDYRIRRKGGTIYLSPDIQSEYFVRARLRKLWRQYVQYGFWKGRFLRQEKSSLRWRHVVPPLFVVTLLATFILALFGLSLGQLAFAALAGLYLSFIVAGGIYTCRGGNWKYLPVMPIIFACIHLGWGSGVCLGALLPDLLSPKEWPR